MEKFKGTPGPWEKHVRKGRIMAVIPKFYGERRLETILYTGTIHDDDCGVETCCCVEEHSNARLIAAAPDLLSGCQHALETIKQYDMEGHMVMAVEELQAAITKAIKP